MNSRTHAVRKVRVDGSRGGTFPATTTQTNVLDWLGTEPAEVLYRAVELPPDCTLDRVVEAVRTLVARHETLRTVYPHPSGTVQRVLDHVVLDIVLADEGATRTTAPEAFDLSTEAPLRIGIDMRAGKPLRAHFELSHVAVDEAAAQLVMREFTDLLDPCAKPAPVPHRVQPVDHAAQEQSPAGRRRLAATVEFWERTVGRGAPCLFTMPSQSGSTGYGMVRMSSTAAAVGLAHLAQRLAVSASAAFLSTLGTVLTSWSGNASVALYSTCSNRFHPALREYVGTLAQEAVLVFPSGGGATFGEQIRRFQATSLLAYRHGSYNSRDISEMLNALSWRRGMERHRDCVVNDLSGLAEPPPPGWLDGVGDPYRALGETRITPMAPTPHFDPMRLTITRLAPSVDLILHADLRFVPPDALTGLLRAVERLLVTPDVEQLSPEPAGEVADPPAVRRGPGWHRVGPSWIDLHAVRQAVLRSVGGPTAEVFLTDGPDGLPTLVGCGCVGERVPSAEEVHDTCLNLLTGRHGVMTPQRYILRAEPPADPRDLAAWCGPGVLADATGRGNGAPPPTPVPVAVNGRRDSTTPGLREDQVDSWAGH